MWRAWGNRWTPARSAGRCPRAFHGCTQFLPPVSARPGPAPDDAREVLHLAVGGGPGAHVLLDLEDAVARGRMVTAAERLADLDQRLAAALAHQVHRDVARGGERPRSVRRDQVLHR